MIHETVLKMLEARESGALFTLLDTSFAFQGIKGRHWIWAAERISSDAKAGWESSGLALELSRLGAEVVSSGEFKRVRVEIEADWFDFMIEPILPAPRLLIFGCGHVGQALAALAAIVGFPLIVVDDRPTFANHSLFPVGTQVVCGDFAQAIHELNPNENDYVVVVTRGHQYDRLCLTSLQGRRLKYLGMIGSRRRVTGLFAELAKEGIDTAWIEGIHSPIGLDIGAETPSEIAVSILAEIIQVRRKGTV